MSRVAEAVLDTNVMVSGLLNPFGPPGRLVDALLGRRLRVAFDDRILIEYRWSPATQNTSPGAAGEVSKC